MSALGGEETSLVRDRVSVNDARADLEENRHGDFNLTFPAKNYGLPACELGRNPSKPLRCKGASAGMCGIVPASWSNLSAIPGIAGRDGLASVCQHSHTKHLLQNDCTSFMDRLNSRPKSALFSRAWIRFEVAETIPRQILSRPGKKVSPAAFGGQRSSLVRWRNRSGSRGATASCRSFGGRKGGVLIPG